MLVPRGRGGKSSLTYFAGALNILGALAIIRNLSKETLLQGFS